MSGIDWAVLTAYLVGIVGFGVWAGRGNRRIDDFFLAGRTMRWWAVGLSVMATQISAITFIGTTGQAYVDGMRFLVFYFGLPFAMVALCVTLVPFFYRARVFTAYEYLERRFDTRTRTLTSLLFLMSRGLAVGVTLYAPSLVLSVVLGWSEHRTILLMGLSTIAYVLYGGNRSVIWTDVVQMVLIWVGIFVALGAAIAQIPQQIGFKGALALAQAAGRLSTIDPTPSLTQPYTLWGGLIGGFFLMLSYFGCDQSQVQRYLAGRSLKESRLSLLFNAFLKIPMQFLILLTGVLVFVFYHFHEPPLLWNRAERRFLEQSRDGAAIAGLDLRHRQAWLERRAAAETYAAARSRAARAAYLAAQDRLQQVRTETTRLVEKNRRSLPGGAGFEYNDTNYVFPTYVVSRLPRGLTGLVIAVIFAAAMSTLSGELNSLATASMVDFYRRFMPSSGGDARELLVSRGLTALWGLFACFVALQAGQLGSAIEVVNRFGSYFYGSILGVFALAVLTPRVGARGAFYGLFLGMEAVAAVALFTKVHFLWFNVVGAGTVMVAGLAIDRLVKLRDARREPGN